MKEKPLFRLVPMTEEEARQICLWKYEGEYAVFNWPDWEELARKGEEFADPDIRRQQYFSVLDSNGILAGFVQFFPMLGITRLGLGMRPDLCGKGLSGPFLEAAVCEALRQKPENGVDLEVLTWNERAIRAYRKAGFVVTDTYVRPTPAGDSEFHCMVYSKQNTRLTSNKQC